MVRVEITEKNDVFMISEKYNLDNENRGFLILIPEKAMAPHSSTLAWRLPWTEEPGGLQSMGSRRVGHD